MRRVIGGSCGALPLAAVSRGSWGRGREQPGQRSQGASHCRIVSYCQQARRRVRRKAPDRVTSRLVVCLTGVARLRERPQEGSGDQRCCCWQLGKSAAARASSARALQGPAVSHTCDGDWCQLLSRMLAGKGIGRGSLRSPEFSPRRDLSRLPAPFAPALSWPRRETRTGQRDSMASYACAGGRGQQSFSQFQCNSEQRRTAGGDRGALALAEWWGRNRSRRLPPGPQSRRLVSGCGPGDARRLSDNRARASERASAWRHCDAQARGPRTARAPR